MNSSFRIVNQLSQHTFEIEDNEGNRFIQKKYLQELQSDDYLMIFDLLQKQPCSNIVQVLEITKEYDVILEKCDLDLYQYMQIRKDCWFTNDEIFNILSQIVNGYQHLRNLKITHRQLTPKNILIKQIGSYSLFKISNFSISKLTSLGLGKTVAGLPLYMAPEVREGRTSYTDQCDIYSLGILLYQLCCAELPFIAKNMQDIVQFHEKIKYIQFKCQQKISQLLIDLIQKMIVYKPEDRITWDQLSNNSKLQSQIKIIGNYLIDFQKMLGSGMQGTVYETINIKTQSQCCTKIIDNTSIEGQREKEIYQQIRNQQQSINIIEILDIHDQGNQTFLFLEKGDENLLQFSRKNKQVNDKIVLTILKSIVNAYLHLRNLNVIHRDLKPENIMIKYEGNEAIFKIIDFGIGKIIDKSNQIQTVAGTPIHTAPEILLGYPYNDQCDIFSLGTIMYWFIYRKQYCNPISLDDLKTQVLSLKIHPIKCQHSEQITKKYTNLVEKMLIFNPLQRITWEQLRIALDDNPLTIVQQPFNEDIDLKYLESLQYFTNKVQISIFSFLQHETQPKLLEQLQNLLTFISNFCLALLLDIFELMQKGTCLIRLKETYIQFFLNNVNDFQNLMSQIEAQEKFLDQIKQKITSYSPSKDIQEYQELGAKERQSCGDAHELYWNYYSQIRQNIQNQENVIPIKERYYLEKIYNIFYDYPIQNRKNINYAHLAGKILIENNCKAYLNEKLYNA